MSDHTDRRDCRCGPACYLPCDECEGGCWRCVNGLIALTPEEAALAEVPLLIVHDEFACA